MRSDPACYAPIGHPVMHALDLLDHLLANGGPDTVTQPLHERVSQESLANAIEFAAVRWHWWRETGQDLARVLCSATSMAPKLADLGSSARLVDPGIAAGRGELCEVPSDLDGWSAGGAFAMFEERFNAALRSAGVPVGPAYLIAGALGEMAGNAREHARSSLPPVASFSVASRGWEFSVTDVGRGVVGSLRENPRYADVADDVTALGLAVQDGVSGTGVAGRGHGFTSLFRALVDRDCSIRLRSVCSAASWTGRSPGAHQLAFTVLPRRRGMDVAVSGHV